MQFKSLLRAVICLLSCYWSLAVAQQLDVYVLDVGEGQAVLLSKGEHAVLIDTGHAGKARGVLDRMSELGIRHLDYLLLTHLHPDHASGYFRIREQFPQALVMDNCHPLNRNRPGDMVKWVADALERDARRRCVAGGDRIDWRGTSLSILWPSNTADPGKGLNHNSLVVQVEQGDSTLLVMGDADKAAEKALLRLYRLQPVDVLVVGHHGAEDASAVEFLRAVRPHHAVISVNRDNRRGYPSQQTLQRIRGLGSTLFLTSGSGEYHRVFE